MKQDINFSISRLPGLAAQHLNFPKLMGILLVALSVAVAARAQQTTATIVGNVTDSSGAAVPGAKVTASDNQTNTLRTTVTDKRRTVYVAVSSYRDLLA